MKAVLVKIWGAGPKAAENLSHQWCVGVVSLPRPGRRPASKWVLVLPVS